VVLTDEDFKHANVKASEIEITTFCDAADIRSVYYEKPYYLSAAKEGSKVYSLLRRGLAGGRRTTVRASANRLGRMGIATILSIAQLFIDVGGYQGGARTDPLREHGKAWQEDGGVRGLLHGTAAEADSNGMRMPGGPAIG
jgi:hypothetical protein